MPPVSRLQENAKAKVWKTKFHLQSASKVPCKFQNSSKCLHYKGEFRDGLSFSAVPLSLSIVLKGRHCTLYGCWLWAFRCGISLQCMLEIKAQVPKRVDKFESYVFIWCIFLQQDYPIKPKAQRAMSLSQSAKSAPATYQIRASSLPVPIISQDFLKSPIQPGKQIFLKP